MTIYYDFSECKGIRIYNFEMDERMIEKKIEKTRPSFLFFFVLVQVV